MASSKVQQNRDAKSDRIKVVARQCLSSHGADGLSLRQVARIMGESSSALYRYFRNRDALLTALIIDAYNDLGAAAEVALRDSATDAPIQQLVVVASAIRYWAFAHRSEYALIFGSPVPNYVAPESTIAPAGRIPAVLAQIVTRAPTSTGSFGSSPLSNGVLNTAALATLLPGASADVMGRALLAWSSVFGLISFELFGHFEGSVLDAHEFFTSAVYDLGHNIGLSETTTLA